MRSEDIIPEELRRWLQRPQAKYVLSCAVLVFAAVACFWGLRKIAEKRLEPIPVQLTPNEQAILQQAWLRGGLWGHKFEAGRPWVPAGKLGDYLRVMSDVDLGTRDAGEIMRRATNGTSLLLTSEERHWKLQLAVEDAVAKLLQAITGIDDAYVHFDETTLGGLRQAREITAVVSVQPSPGVTIDGKLLSSIRRTVAAHKAGLSESNVTVVNRESGDSYDGSILVADPVAQSREMQRVTLQREWDDKLTRVLKFIPAAQVETCLTLADMTESAEPLSALRPRRITISIGIPLSYYHSVWRQQVGENGAPSPSAAELAELEAQTQAKVESLVEGLVASSAGDGSPSLHLALFRQLDTSAASVTRTESPSAAWLSKHSNKMVQGLLVALALGLVFVAFRDLFYEDVPVEDRAPANDELRVFADDAAEEQRFGGASSLSPRAVRPPGIPTEKSDSPFVHPDLTDLVREHPQAASAMLKSWVEKAS